MMKRLCLLGVLVVANAAMAGCDPEPTMEERGAQVYAEYCALCHGDNGEGYAADRANAISNQAFLAVADDSLIGNAIVWGRPGTSMSAWGETRGGPLSASQVEDLLGYIRSWQTVGTVDLGAVQVGEGGATRGLAAYEAHCRSCHGKLGQGDPFTSISNPVFLATASDEFLKYVIAQGREGTRMAGYQDVLTNQSLDDLVALLRAVQEPVDDTPVEPPSTDLGDPILNPTGDEPKFDSDGLYVKLADLKVAYEDKAKMVIVDARASSDYSVSHIKGAVSVPFYDVQDFLAQLPRDTWIVAYCACPHAASEAVANVLLSEGYDKVKVLDEGYDAWVAAELPVSTGPKP